MGGKSVRDYGAKGLWKVRWTFMAMGPDGALAFMGHGVRLKKKVTRSLIENIE